MHGGGKRWALGMALALALFAAAAAPAQQDAVLTGTDAADAMTGTDASEALYGRAGDDTLDGAGGDDTLDGGPGADVLRGGPGHDAAVYDGTAAVTVTLDGAPGDGAAGERDSIAPDVEDVFTGAGADLLTGDAGPNQLDGGDGDDRLAGGAGRDGLIGGDGSDIVDARDGEADHVDCGPGADTALVDPVDAVAGCEKTEVARLPGVVRAFATGRTTRVVRLQATNMPAGGTVRLSCRGRGCPFRRPRTFIAKGSTIRLDEPFRGARLRRGATIVVQLTAPATPSRTFRFEVRGASRPMKETVPE